MGAIPFRRHDHGETRICTLVPDRHARRKDGMNNVSLLIERTPCPEAVMATASLARRTLTRSSHATPTSPVQNQARRPRARISMVQGMSTCCYWNA